MIFEERFITANGSYTRPKLLQPAGIVIHSTGVNQRRIGAYWWQFNNPDIRASVHGFIGLNDNGRLAYRQTLPYTLQCWGCGSGKNGSYNATHIQFEICEDLQNKEWTEQTYAAALDVCEILCRKYNIMPDRVVCHSEAHSAGYASNHGDVMHWWPKYKLSMDKFRKELTIRLEDMMQTRYKTIDDVPAALQQETRMLIASGALRGNENGLDVTEDMLRTMIICKRYTDAQTAADEKLYSGLISE